MIEFDTKFYNYVHKNDMDKIIENEEENGWILVSYICNADTVNYTLQFQRPTRLASYYDENNNELQDLMIYATRNNNTNKDKILDIFISQGLFAVFNLGLETMYKYLTGKDKN